jgi:tRNA G10  N-methylase Trm11
MFEYFFLLGRAFDLCREELEGLLSSFDAKIVSETDGVVIVSSDLDIPLDELLFRAGGVIKAGRLVGETSDLEDVRTKIVDLANEKFSDTKFRFGASLYGKVGVGKMVKEMVVQLDQDFKQRGLKGSYVLPDGSEMTSVQIDKYKLLGEKGADFVLIMVGEIVKYGLTESVQPFEQWSKADYGRPDRDAKSGMLPPKVARMMINLGIAKFKKERNGWQKELTIYDPFCGSGTVLTEGLRVGCRVGGSDLSEKAVRDTISNIDWLMGSGLYQIEEGKPDRFFGYKHVALKAEEIAVRASEVAHVQKIVTSGSIQVIVTEPYLGPVFNEDPTPGKLERIIKGLEKMYIGGLSSMREILVPGGVIVFAEPIFFMPNKSYKVGIIDNPDRFGYTLESKIVEYKRDKAFVGRRIGVLVKK